MTTPMTCDDIQSMIPDVLEGTLSDERRAPYEAHVARCEACRSLVIDLAKIRDDAASLAVFSPSRDLWSGIESRLETPVLSISDRPRGIVARWTSRQVAAAAAVLVSVTAGGTWLAATRSPAAPSVAAVPAVNAPAVNANARTELVEVADQKGIATYEGEIAKLRTVLDTRRGELDKTTIAVVEKNLRLIDQAISESKAALAADPASAFLAGRLNHAYDTKLQLLRSAALLPSRS
jgi:anti-sigma factor RsiW